MAKIKPTKTAVEAAQPHALQAAVVMFGRSCAARRADERFLACTGNWLNRQSPPSETDRAYAPAGSAACSRTGNQPGVARITAHSLSGT